MIVWIMCVFIWLYIYRRAAQWDQLHEQEFHSRIRASSNNEADLVGACNTDQALSAKHMERA